MTSGGTRGFTLLEIVIAMVILAFAMVSIAGALTVAERRALTSGDETAALLEAERPLELLRSESVLSLLERDGEVLRDVTPNGFSRELEIRALDEYTVELVSRVYSPSDGRLVVTLSTTRTLSVAEEIEEAE